MFTGIVEERGIVAGVENKKNLVLITIRVSKLFASLRVGDSVCVNGVCLTMTVKKGGCLTFAAMKETLRATTLGQLRKGSVVNLERAMKANSRLGGHFVTGHIDYTGKILKMTKRPNYVEWQVELPKVVSQFLVPKGSITLDGVSLTLGEVKEKRFSVFLIPHTLIATTLGSKGIGDRLNIEADLLAKYVSHTLKGKGRLRK